MRTGGIKKLLKEEEEGRKKEKYRSQKENKIMRSDDIRISREKRYMEEAGCGVGETTKAAAKRQSEV